MSSARPTASFGQNATGWLRIVLYRYRGVRWMAAAGAAIITFITLQTDPAYNGNGSQSESFMVLEQPQLSMRLPDGTRGMAVPTDSDVFTPGDRVDVHAIRTSKVVVDDVLVIEVTDDDTMIAVPTDRVGAVVDSLTTGGVILALVPQPTRWG